MTHLQPREYLEIIRRRRWWIMLTAIAMSAASLVVIWRLPNIYRAETVILVDPQKVPDNYVASTVTSSIADRLATLQQEVMSPSRLKRLIDSMGLYPEMQGKGKDQAIVAKMQQAITVNAEGGHNLSTFRVAYQGRNPIEVAQVANQLASMFIGENMKAREQQSSGTAEFLDNELQKTKAELEASEKELGDLKSRYILDLPESKQYHLEALTTLRSQLRTSQDKVERAQQEKMYLQTLSATTAPTVDLDATSEGSSPYDSQIQKLEATLSEQKARYGPSHPDVRKVKAELDELKRRAAQDSREAPVAATPAKRAVRNPVIEAQMQKLNETIQAETKAQAQLNDQINFHVSKLERVPIFEQRIAGLMRNYDGLRAHYASLNDKKLAAEMSNNLENRQKAERFVVLDPAQIPDRPVAPNRMLLSLVAIFGSLIGGAGLAMLREMTDEAVRSEREAAEILGRPVLVAVPSISNQTEHNNYLVRAISAVVGTAVASVAAGFLISLLYGGF
ncbi:MAG TPA: Wzz/FepE/Etk N-terminal domain-containing protein [Alphaproteobacteria bacterium]|nr:Wzz/FepE/Etk N-terminal domain-containing protein [Alphaproteobacteria bacterium]